MDQYVNSAQFSIFLSPALSLLPCPTFFLSVASFLFYILPIPSIEFFPFHLSLLFIPPFIFQILLSICKSIPFSPPFHLLICLRCQLTSPHSSPMATCHSVNLSFRFYITVFITSRHPPSLPLFLMRQPFSLPLSPSLFRMWESISVHY